MMILTCPSRGYLKGPNSKHLDKQMQPSTFLSIPLTVVLCTSPVLSGATEVDGKWLSTKLAGWAQSGATVGGLQSMIEQEAHGAVVGYANDKLNLLEDRAKTSFGFTYLDFKFGMDSLSLSSSKSKPMFELMSVYRLYETKNMFLFNQSSLVNYDDRNTLNFGLGARYIDDSERMILGANAFWDQELQSKHHRSGLGLEFLTSVFEVRANKYYAQSNEILYKGTYESALDGNDLKFTANLPYLYSSNVYFKKSKFEDGLGYSMKTEEWGLQGEIIPNLSLTIASQKEGSERAQTVASVSYSIPLGKRADTPPRWQNGRGGLEFKPIREKLYKPVQRENRIMKKAVKLGVTVSGY